MSEMYDSVVEEKKDEIKNTTTDDNYKIATVTSLFEDGCPKITFVGEETESTKEYSYLYSYNPAIGDVVLLIKASNTYVILGKVVHKVSPDPGMTEDDVIGIITENTLSEEEIREIANTQADERIADKKCVLLNSNGVITNTSNNTNSLNNLSVPGTFKHSGSTVGFFGYSSSKQSLSTIYVSTEMTETLIRDKINAIIKVLQAYGLA